MTRFCSIFNQLLQLFPRAEFQKAVIDACFYQACVAQVLGKLAAATEGSGTVLDNTVVLVTNDMSEGAAH